MTKYYDTYEWRKNGANINDIVMTVALPAFKSDKIMFLPLESLKNQKDIDFKWELICFEEDGLSRNLYKSYENKLPGCIRVVHKGINAKKEGIKEGKNKGIYPLIDKWINISKMGAKSSKIYVLHAADDYSTEKRLATHVNHFKNRNCIFSSMPKGIFYNILTKDVILYDYSLTDELYINTHLNMAYRKEHIDLYVDNKTPTFNKNIDGHIRSNVLKGLKINKLTKENHFLDLDKNNWKTGFFTDGYNNISMDRRNIYKTVKEKGESGTFRNEKYVTCWYGDKRLNNLGFTSLDSYIPKNILDRLDDLKNLKTKPTIEHYQNINNKNNSNLLLNIILCIPLVLLILKNLKIILNKK